MIYYPDFVRIWRWVRSKLTRVKPCPECKGKGYIIKRLPTYGTGEHLEIHDGCTVCSATGLVKK